MSLIFHYLLVSVCGFKRQTSAKAKLRCINKRIKQQYIE
nr:MAG TPA: hypothetical protein [Caudoviricetes sp.]